MDSVMATMSFRDGAKILIRDSVPHVNPLACISIHLKLLLFIFAMSRGLLLSHCHLRQSTREATLPEL